MTDLQFSCVNTSVMKKATSLSSIHSLRSHFAFYNTSHKPRRKRPPVKVMQIASLSSVRLELSCYKVAFLKHSAEPLTARSTLCTIKVSTFPCQSVKSKWVFPSFEIK
uniref:Venom toxin n=1 Tax=Hemiscorpius lepturus TaxID=520031 RepID=A0A1L4BJA4_HEMLE|nr:venom toxin [Hemiscorpius lepturus]